MNYEELFKARAEANAAQAKVRELESKARNSVAEYLDQLTSDPAFEKFEEYATTYLDEEFGRFNASERPVIKAAISKKVGRFAATFIALAKAAGVKL